MNVKILNRQLHNFLDKVTLLYLGQKCIILLSYLMQCQEMLHKCAPQLQGVCCMCFEHVGSLMQASKSKYHIQQLQSTAWKWSMRLCILLLSAVWQWRWMLFTLLRWCFSIMQSRIAASHNGALFKACQHNYSDTRLLTDMRFHSLMSQLLQLTETALKTMKAVGISSSVRLVHSDWLAAELTSWGKFVQNIKTVS